MVRISDIQPEVQALGSFQLPGSQSWRLQDEAGDSFRIDVALPEGAPPAAGWPAIFLLDGSGCFATCVEAQRRMARRPDATGVSPAVIVGISHLAGDGSSPVAGNGGAEVPARRQRDFADGDHFLNLLKQKVKSLASEAASIDPSRLTLFGHSLAGYFVLRVLTREPEAFSNYAAISPSIWSGRDALLEALPSLEGQKRHVLVCVGEWEDRQPPWQLASRGSAEVAARRLQRQMIGHAQDMCERLSRHLGAERVQFRLLAEEDHASILSAAIPRMLRMASRGQQVEDRLR